MPPLAPVYAQASGVSAALRENPTLVSLPRAIVVLPAVDAAILVAVDARAQRPRSVHLGPGIDATILIGVVGQLGELSRRLVVGRFRCRLQAFALGVGAALGENRAADGQCRYGERSPSSGGTPHPISSSRSRRRGRRTRRCRRGSCRDRASRSARARFRRAGRRRTAPTAGRGCSWNVDTTGIDPPSRVKTGVLAEPFSMARPAAWTNGLSNSVIHGLPPCMRVTLTSTVFGVIFRRSPRTARRSCRDPGRARDAC